MTYYYQHLLALKRLLCREFRDACRLNSRHILLNDDDKYAKVQKAFREIIQSAQALRRSCTYPAAIKITEILLKHHKTLKFDINEKSGKDEQAAIHHAGRKLNKAAYDLLVQYDAKVDLTDKAGLTGQAYLLSVRATPGNHP